MTNLYILTEERAKPNVLIRILEIYSDKFSKQLKKGQLKIIPNLFSFYDKIEKIDFVELKEESFEKEKEFKYYYYNNEKIKSINKKYSVLYY